MDREYYWAQPDADIHGRWVVCANPAAPFVISMPVDKDVAEKAAKNLCESKKSREANECRD